jgi:hypothetical protein
MVLAVAMGLVFGIAQLLQGGADTAGEAAQVVGAQPSSGSSTPTTRPEPAAKTAEPTSKSAKKARQPGKTRTPLPQPSGPCTADDIVVTPAVDGAAHAGSRVTFRLDVTTLSSPACTWQVSAESLAVKIVSGSDRIWSTQDCPEALREVDVVARQEKAATVALVWRGQRSDATCSRTTDWAQPGWYHVQAAAFGAEPTDVQFELRPAVRATITPKPKPEKTSKSRTDSEKSD